jgi:hypothetical protein
MLFYAVAGTRCDTFLAYFPKISPSSDSFRLSKTELEQMVRIMA